MPELPEVETVVRQLRPQLRKRVIRGCQVLDRKIKIPKLSSKTITNILRVGKEIAIELDSKEYLCIHLRMTGRLIIVTSNQAKDLARFYFKTSIDKKHLRFKMQFDKFELHFIDPRRFGTIKMRKSIELEAVDPVSGKFTKTVFLKLIGNSTQPLKNWLMRQDKLVGIGNIYASEILFASKLSPLRKINTLNVKEQDLLFKSIKSILLKAIKYCGTTFSDFQTTTGEIGSFQKFLKVYGRVGGRCFRCNAIIKKIVQQQRSTFYCEKCQK